MRTHSTRSDAAVTIVALLSLVILSLVAASILRNVVPRYYFGKNK